MLLRTFLCFCLSFMLALPAFAAEERTLIVVQDATWPPMEFVDSDKNIVGYSVDYLDAVAKEAGFKFIHKNMEWEGIFAELAAGKCDVLASSITITEDRKKSMDFSTPYAEVKQAVIVRKDSSIFNEADLQGKTIGAQISTTGFFAAEKIPKSTSKSYDILGLAIEDLANGRIDAVICDNPVAADYALKKEEYAKALKIACIIKDADIEEYGFAVRKGDTATLELLNKGIAAVKEKGIETELMNKWFGE